MGTKRLVALAFATAVVVPGVRAAESDADLARKLQNPIAALISVPLQSNYDSGFGRDGDGWQYKLNVQPVVPIALNKEWNLISRTIVPIVTQNEVVSGTGDQSGLGDVVQSFFFSPQAATASGWIWGAGPVLLVPTATNDYQGAKFHTTPMILAPRASLRITAVLSEMRQRTPPTRNYLGESPFDREERA